MKTSSVTGLTVLLSSIAALYACSAQPQDARPIRPSGDAGSGASSGSGTGTAGTYGTAGINGTSGTYGTAGINGTSGTYGTAGINGTSGTYGTAGAGTAGAGTAGAGIAGAGTAGAGTAGAGTAGAGTAGAGTAGAPGVTCDATFAAGVGGFVRAPAAGGGCWHGYAFRGVDAKSMLSSPKDFSACTATCPLNLTGSIAAADASTGFLGFNVDQAATGGAATAIAPTGTALVVSWTGSFTGLRIQLNADMTGTLFWCAVLPATSPATIPYGSLNTACWGTTGTAYAKQAIIGVELSLPGSTSGGVQAANVTLTSITEM